MLPIFANPIGLWALLGVPAILAIHFLQQRARIARTSTWFLIEQLSPDSARGRTWDRLRSSRQLWLQLLAVLVAAWVLAEPRWVRAESAQTVVLVLDASAAMDAFREPARTAAEREMSRAEGLAARTTWVAMTTNPRQPPLYRGLDRIAATEAMARWQPELGSHDLAPALRLAQGLAGASGSTLLITDQRAKVPPDQRAAGVGRAIDNVGFAGANVTRGPDGATWRALVKNHATTAQRRAWHLEAAGSRSPEQSLELAPGALTEISARLPEGANEATVVLAADAFAADDRLPFVRPAPKPLTVAVDGKDDAAEFFRRLASDVDGVTVVAAGATASLRMARLSAEEVAREPHGGIFWPPADQRQQAPLATEPVTPERDSLVGALNWQGWFGTGVHGYAMVPGDQALLWQGRFPLVFLRPASEERAKLGVPARKLLFAFDWATANASRLPATVLLVRRFLETERDAQRAPYAANFDAHSSLTLASATAAAGNADEVLTLAFQPANGGAPELRSIPPVERSELRAPGRAGFFTLKSGEEPIVRGAAQFADTRQGDFRAAEKFFVELPAERRAVLERNTRADPFSTGWLVVLAGLVLGSWWVRGSGGESQGKRVADNAEGSDRPPGARPARRSGPAHEAAPPPITS
ncbi:MAG: BatA domain-containing protein [Opitutaceae bacterium]